MPGAGLAHAIGNVSSASLRPFVQTLVADWTHARLTGQPTAASEGWYDDAMGRIEKTALA